LNSIRFSKRADRQHGIVEARNERIIMNIQINAKVSCTDGDCGQISCVIVNPITDALTHIVVRENTFPHEERLTPIKYIQETSSESVHLNCTLEEFFRMDHFIKHEYIELDRSYGGYAAGRYVYLPYASPIDEDFVDIEHERIPTGELAIHRGAEVEAVDGRVGKVDEFLVEPTSGHITHLIMREGHIWDQKDVTIPVSEIDHVEDNIVYLKADKNNIDALPTIPVHRWF
jgi:sporulation protein YlmC with PRC-barrel domain